MGGAYPVLLKDRDLIKSILEREEAGFARTLRTGMSLLEEARHEVESTGATVFPGEVAFRLHDTHGFPIELTSEIVAESGLGVDRAAFDAAMSQQRERARANSKALHLADEAQYRGDSQHQAHVPGFGLILVMNVVIGNGQDGAVVQ